MSQDSLRSPTDFLCQCGGYAVVNSKLTTELERRGADLNDPLWSAKCLICSPHLVRRRCGQGYHIRLTGFFRKHPVCEDGCPLHAKR